MKRNIGIVRSDTFIGRTVEDFRWISERCPAAADITHDNEED